MTKKFWMDKTQLELEHLGLSRHKIDTIMTRIFRAGTKRPIQYVNLRTVLEQIEKAGLKVFRASEVAKLTGQSKTGVQRAMKMLIKQKVIVRLSYGIYSTGDNADVREKFISTYGRAREDHFFHPPERKEHDDQRLRGVRKNEHT